MFKVSKAREVWWPVTVNVPQDGGKLEAHEFDLHIRLAKRTEWQKLVKVQEGALSEDEAAEFIAEHVLGWERIADEAGEALPFTRENLTALLEDAWFARAVAISLLQASVGAPAKN